MEEAEVRRHLRVKLPDFMVPGQVMRLQALPRTSSGKIDRSALPIPQRLSENVQIESPQTELEEKILTIWKKILNTDVVGVNDNFFEVGGTSISLLTLAVDLDEAGIEIEPIELFRLSTVREQSDYFSSINPIPLKY
nr:phosphopantetheine-binding protein [Paenibacillus cucumis (ex Kampfer et al. 2016)]